VEIEREERGEKFKKFVAISEMRVYLPADWKFKVCRVKVDKKMMR
jgi:hypothetical protein